jgi:hypothetical protein
MASSIPFDQWIVRLMRHIYIAPGKWYGMSGRYILHPLEGRYAIRDLADDQLIRGWRKGATKLIWRGTEDEALALIAQFEKSTPKGEMDKSQKIHYMVRARKRQKVTSVAPFLKCTECGNMVKDGHTC